MNLNDISIKWGGTWVIPFTVETALDFTALLKFQVKRTKDSEVVLMEAEDISVDETTQEAEVSLTAADWEQIPNKTMDYWYGTRLYNEAGTVDVPFLEGKFKVEISVAT
jgi:hypothetical protein